MDWLLEGIDKNTNTVFACGEEEYKEALGRILEGVASKYDRICLVELNKPYKTVKRELEEKNVDSKKFYFIDCVTLTSNSMAQGGGEAVLLPDQTSLSRITFELGKAIKERGIQLTVFDSISTLLIYNPEVRVMTFLNTIITGVRTSETKAAYFVFKSDMDKSLLNDLELFADAIIEPKEKKT